jgi:hypothetical protein
LVLKKNYSLTPVFLNIVWQTNFFNTDLKMREILIFLISWAFNLRSANVI